jgi:NAD(P)H-hydrate epimerase
MVLAALSSEASPAWVLDADALNLLAGELERIRRSRADCVLTPHHGEAQRLLGRSIATDLASRKAAARELAERSGAVVSTPAAIRAWPRQAAGMCWRECWRPIWPHGTAGWMPAGRRSTLLAQLPVCTLWRGIWPARSAACAA